MRKSEELVNNFEESETLTCITKIREVGFTGSTIIIICQLTKFRNYKAK